MKALIIIILCMFLVGIAADQVAQMRQKNREKAHKIFKKYDSQD